MTIEPEKMKAIAAAYTSAWNSGSAEAVAEFYAKKGHIVINRGEPWEGRARVAAGVHQTSRFWAITAAFDPFETFAAPHDNTPDAGFRPYQYSF